MFLCAVISWSKNARPLSNKSVGIMRIHSLAIYIPVICRRLIASCGRNSTLMKNLDEEASLLFNMF